jgi:protein involved in polysaccharide export with SLBB domain
MLASATTAAQYETRAQLEAQARAAESQQRTAEASLLRARLRQGDFQEGDRIVVVLDNTPTVVDTLQVRTGRVIQFPRMGDVLLEGVLRSELSTTMRRHLAKYLTNPGVRATPLLPLAVLGNVGYPGYYYAAADMVVRDLIMRAGGPRDADLNRIIVRRNGETIWREAELRQALSEGLSLDRLHLRAGDEIFVPARRKFPVGNIVAAVTSTLALTVTLIQLQQK